MSLIRAGKRNVLANYFSFLVTTVVTIAVSPLLVGILGAGYFGLWKAIQKFMDFGTIADGRATQALKWIIAHGLKTNSDLERRQAVGSAVVVWAIFLSVTVTFGLAMVVAMPSLVADVKVADHAIVRMTAGILALNLVLVPLLGISDAVLVGTNQGYASTVVKTVIFALSNVAMVLVAWLGMGLAPMATCVLVASIASALVIYWQARRRLPWFGWARPSSTDVKRFFNFSGWVLIWALVSKVLLGGDLLLIGYFAGPIAVTDYVFTSYAAQFAVAICFMTSSALMPGVGGLIGANDQMRTRVAVAGVRELNDFLAVTLCGGVILFNRAFVELWGGEQRYMGWLVDLLIACEAVQLIRIRNEAQLQDLTLKIGRKVGVGMASVACSLACAWVLYSVVHATWAIFVGSIVGRLLMSVSFPAMVDRVCGARDTRWRVQTIIVYFFIGACALVSWLMQEETKVASAAAGIPTMGLVVVIAWFVLLGPGTRTRLHGTLLQSLGR